MENNEPLISFTFDDFPRSALHIAGTVLEQHGWRGTYYTSLGLMGQTTATGEMFVREDLTRALAGKHELGCHTYSHCHSYETPAREFELSSAANREALKALEPKAKFESLSYPISCPNPGVKRTSGRSYLGCRAGGQTFNHGRIDLNNLRSFFLEQSRDDFAPIRAVIDDNRRAGGWLIFSTHDVCDNPTRYGCQPEFFRSVIDYVQQSSTRVVPISVALQLLGATKPYLKAAQSMRSARSH